MKNVKPRNVDKQGPFLKRIENVVHWINYFPVDSVLGFVNIYSLVTNSVDITGLQDHKAALTSSLFKSFSV